MRGTGVPCRQVRSRHSSSRSIRPRRGGCLEYAVFDVDGAERSEIGQLRIHMLGCPLHRAVANGIDLIIAVREQLIEDEGVSRKATRRQLGARRPIVGRPRRVGEARLGLEARRGAGYRHATERSLAIAAGATDRRRTGQTLRTCLLKDAKASGRDASVEARNSKWEPSS